MIGMSIGGIFAVLSASFFGVESDTLLVVITVLGMIFGGGLRLLLEHSVQRLIDAA